ncbi:hypothetical protein B0I32_13939 [Nonomuraea fuscirosea]|uniref:Uncharacterized protein n=1 Tax=Nonomuraea fuscirosea TaxID=1291556 RepID=A0A2T0LXU5_9ACTN|nr:hypothetical protein B0I32_13939 [Nonomuraea fuscirosea]
MMAVVAVPTRDGQGKILIEIDSAEDDLSAIYEDAEDVRGLATKVVETGDHCSARGSPSSRSALRRPSQWCATYRRRSSPTSSRCSSR